MTVKNYPNVFFIVTRRLAKGREVRYPGFLNEREYGGLPFRRAGKPFPPGFRLWRFFAGKGPGDLGDGIWPRGRWAQVQTIPEHPGDLTADLTELLDRPDRYRVVGAYGKAYGQTATKGEAQKLLQAHLQNWRCGYYPVGRCQTGYTAVKRSDGSYALNLRARCQFDAFIEKIRD